jgi:hypothetical protein
MSEKLTFPVYYILLLSIFLTSPADAAKVVPRVYIGFDGTLTGTNYALGLRELDNTGTFTAHNGTEIVSNGMGILTDADQFGQESFQFDASMFNNGGIEFTGIAFIAEAVFTAANDSAFMAPVIDIGGQCFIRFHNGLSAGCWDGSVEVVNNNIQPIPEVGQTFHYAIVYDGRDTIDYYLDGIRIFQSDNGSPQQITPLISWGNIRHTTVDGGRQLMGRYDSVAFSTFTGVFNPDTDFILPDGPVFLELASNPAPADESTEVLQDTVLNWTPGLFAASHDVYLGTVFENVDNAERDNPLDVLAFEGLGTSIYDPGRLEFDQRYYWRIDEVNSPPDSTIYKGKIWSFITESLAYRIPGERITATASSQMPGQGPERTNDDSGLVDGLHSVELSDMWLSGMDDAGPVWIQYEFDKIYKLHEMSVWNFNGPSVLVLYGIKDVTVEYSIDEVNWTQIDSVTEFAQAAGQADYAPNTVIAFEGAPAKYVRINPVTSWGGENYNLFGISEVGFMKIPVDARGPSPEDGATDVAIDSKLTWKMGREAVGHNMYFSDDRQAVADGTAPVVTIDQSIYDPSALDLNTAYYWRVDEVNDTGTMSVWQGDVWSFTTRDYLVVDDFESYNDVPNGQQGSRLVYDIWLDGIADPAKGGSQTGYFEGTSYETDIVHGGRKSVPILYDNTTSSFSEVTANTNDIEIGPNWTVGNPNGLVLYFYGDPDNSTTDQMYVKVNGVKVIYNGDLTEEVWREFSVDFADLGIDLNNVTSLTIGFESTGAAGGPGMVFIDDIRLHAF